MKYAIKAHPTVYGGVQFRSRLEAKWAAFFDLINWKWQYEPIDLPNWTPDFRVTFPCGHSECAGKHSLLVEIKPYFQLSDFIGHPCMDYPYGGYTASEGRKGVIPADASAAFGAHPSITHWEMAHGAGGGTEELKSWVYCDIDAMWKEAGNIVQWIPGEEG